MNTYIRPMNASDRDEVLGMMREFYSSPAVFTNGSEEIFRADIETCVSGSPYLEGYVFEGAEGIQGYAMAAKSFSTEFGRGCIWIEDIFIREEFRGLGIGKMFLDFIAAKYPDCILRLEVEEENERACRLYEKCGFTVLPYTEMKK